MSTYLRSNNLFNQSSSSSTSIVAVKRRRRAFRSDNYFTKVRDENGYYWSCNECQRSFAMNSSAGHRKCHINTHKNIVSNFHDMTSQDKEEAIVKLIVDCSLSYSIVENETFRLVTDTNLSRRRMSDMIIQKAAQIKQQLRFKLSRIECASLTMDMWTSIATRGYLCVTIHFIQDNKLFSSLLDLSFLPTPHTGSQIYNRLKELFFFYDLDGKIVSITGDRAGNNGSAIRLWNSTYPSMCVNREYCVAHLLNNVIDHSTKLLDSTITKARHLSSSIKCSSKRSTKLREILTSMHMKEMNLMVDVPTRWNSLFMMVERLLLLKPAVEVLLTNAIIDDHDLTEYNLEDSEWRKLENLVEILKPFKHMTDYFSSDKTSNASSIVPIYKNILEDIDQARLDIPEIRFITDKLHTELVSLKDCFHTESNMLACALDPYWNIDFDRRTLESILKPELDKVSSSLPSINENSIHNGHRIFQRRKESSDESRQKDELTKYMEVEVDKPVDFISWWTLHADHFPNLYSIAKRIMTRRSTSVASEAQFSRAGHMIGRRRARLGDESIAACMFLKSNLALEGVAVSEDEE